MKIHNSVIYALILCALALVVASYLLAGCAMKFSGELVTLGAPASYEHSDRTRGTETRSTGAVTEAQK